MSNDIYLVRFLAELVWECPGCEYEKHRRDVPLGLPRIERYVIMSTCRSFHSTRIMLTERLGLRLTPPRPLTDEWDTLEWIATVRPELFGWERSTRPAVAHWPGRITGQSFGYDTQPNL